MKNFILLTFTECSRRARVSEFKIQAVINNMNNINLSTTINYDALLIASNERVVTFVYLFRSATLELPYIRA